MLERFFDESGGMQLVLHAPFGSRINKAWCLALRKRFCRQFNFELQAAATEDALLLSLGPQHSFPLADVFRYLHPESTARRAGAGVSRRAGLQDALALERDHLAGGAANPRRAHGGAAAAADARRRSDGRGVSRRRRLPREHSRRSPDSRSSAGQPDRARLSAGGDGLRRPARVLERIHRGELRLVARDTPEPSVFAHDILNARPYAFLDDAPLEERRAHAVQTRRARPRQRGRRRRRARRGGDRARCATRRGLIRATPTSCTTR